MTERLEFDGGCSWGLGRDYIRRWHHETRQRGGRLGPQAGVLSLVPGLFSTDAEESTRSLRSLLRMCVAQEPARENLYLTLGYNVSVPPSVRQALLSRSFDNDDLLPTLQSRFALPIASSLGIVQNTFTRFCGRGDTCPPRDATDVRAARRTRDWLARPAALHRRRRRCRDHCGGSERALVRWTSAGS